MNIEEKIEKNREVFQNSPFFAYPRESISREITEHFPETHEENRMQEEPDWTVRKGKSVSIKNEAIKETETQLVFTEELLVQKEIPVFEKVSIREMSDELERLSQRYGRGMEEWLDDQSSL